MRNTIAMNDTRQTEKTTAAASGNCASSLERTAASPKQRLPIAYRSRQRFSSRQCRSSKTQRKIPLSTGRNTNKQAHDITNGTGRGIHVDDGIKCTMWVATADGLEGKSGGYFHNGVTEFLDPEELGRGDLMTPVAADPAEATACWAQSLAMLRIPEAAFGQNA